MFKLSFKRTKKIRVSDLREREPSPQKNWSVILGLLFSWILVCVLAYTYLFLRINKEDVSSRGSKPGEESDIVINVKQLQSAADFVTERMEE